CEFQSFSGRNFGFGWRVGKWKNNFEPNGSFVGKTHGGRDFLPRQRFNQITKIRNPKTSKRNPDYFPRSLFELESTNECRRNFDCADESSFDWEKPKRKIGKCRKFIGKSRFEEVGFEEISARIFRRAAAKNRYCKSAGGKSEIHYL